MSTIQIRANFKAYAVLLALAIIFIVSSVGCQKVQKSYGGKEAPDSQPEYTAEINK